MTVGIRLLLRPNTTDRYDAYIGDDLVCTSREPLFDGARALLARGYNPDTMLTTRHEGKSFDNSKPAAIGAMALLTTKEDGNGPRAVT